MSLKVIVSASLLALGAITLVAPLPVYAATSADMKMLDPDSDGTVSLAEAQAAGAKSSRPRMPIMTARSIRRKPACR